MSLALVSCICPTTPDRQDYLRLAVECFDRQTYPNRELVIVDEPGTVGAKRNICCDRAKGELICHWDSDDWYTPSRIYEQVQAMQDNPGIQATAYNQMLFARDSDQKAWRYLGDNLNVVGVSLMYRRDWWRQHQFDDSLGWGEDNRFVDLLTVEGKLLIANGSAIVARIHPGNICPKSEDRNLHLKDRWQTVLWSEVLATGYQEAFACV